MSVTVDYTFKICF